MTVASTDSFVSPQPPVLSPAQSPTPSPNLAERDSATSTAVGGRRTWSGNRRVAELGVTAILAAAVASGTTLVATHDQGTVSAATSSVSSAPVAGASWTAVAANVAPSVVSLTVSGPDGTAQGSGVVWDDQGRIVTNNHVVAGVGAGANVTVTFSDGRTYPARVTGTDPTTDLAAVTVTHAPSALAALSRGNSADLRVGDPVMAIGNPLGLSGTVTTGIVSALSRPVAAGGDSSTTLPTVTNAIQTSAPINPGNSGGALVDAHGRLVGINSSIATLGASSGGESGNIGIGFAIPVNEVSAVVDQLIANGHAQHAYLGIRTRDTTVKQGESSIAGALVGAVSPGTAAAQAGVGVGDGITALNGQAVTGSDGLVGGVRALSVGQRVTLSLIRAGQTLTVETTLAAAPAA